MNPLAAGIAIARSVQRWREGPDRTTIYRDHFEEWSADNARRIVELAQNDDALAERLDSLEQDGERILVLGNFGLEAWREANDRRRAMLGDATVALIFSELTAAELARVERTIRMLDPEDLDTLRTLGDPGAMLSGQMLYDWVLTQSHLGGAALTASGCIRLVGVMALDAAPTVTVTPLGALVLRFMGSSTLPAF